MILNRSIAVEMMKVVKFLHVELGEFANYTWTMKEREMSKISSRLSV